MRVLALLPLVTVPLAALADTTLQADVADDLVYPIAYDAPMTMEDVIALANLDDDPSVISPDEKEMIALLVQMLGASPVQN